VGVPADPGPLDGPTAAAYDATLGGLRDLGVEVAPCPTSLARESGGISLLTMLHESAVLYADEVAAGPERFGAEVRALLTLGRPLADRAADLARARTRLADATLRLFADHRLDAFLTPTTPCVAPRRDSPTVDLGGREVPVANVLARFTAWAATTGLPAVSVPAPTGADALPVGVQVMTRPCAEPLALGLALAVEGLTD
jgi:aspartyl-tRNA(Asn)/glutamyl-tRNA(Gln) amidotransferase subunit A